MKLLHWIKRALGIEKRAHIVDTQPLRARFNEVNIAGGTKHLVDLKKGNHVLSFDPKTGRKVSNKIKSVEVLPSSEYFLVFNQGITIHMHQSVVQDNGSETHAFLLKIGDNLVDANGKSVLITSIDKVFSPYPFVKLEVDNDHTYILNGILVHNASRYWVGGTASWDATVGTKWSGTSGGAGGSSVPVAADDVFFDASSGTVTVTVASTPAQCLSLNFTGFTGTWAGSVTTNIAGSLTLATGMTRSYTGTINFTSTSTGRTITFSGKTTASVINFTGVGGGWTLQDACNNGISAFSHTNGALNTNGQTITCRAFSTTGSDTRTLTLGASVLTMSGNWTASGSALTFSGASSTINITKSAATFAGSTYTYGTVNLTSITGTLSLTGACTMGALTVTINAAASTINAIFNINNNITVSGACDFSGFSITTRRLAVVGPIGAPITITAGSTIMTNVDFRDITGAGAAGWTGTSFGDAGGNSGITFTAAVTRFWVGGTGNWSDAAEWSATSGGAGGATAPLAQDTATFDANSFTAASQTVTADKLYLGKDISFTGVTNTPTLAFTGTTVNYHVLGSLTLVSGMTITHTAPLYFAGRGSHNITTAGKVLGSGVSGSTNFINGVGGTYTLLDDFSTDRNIQIQDGTVDFNDFNVSCQSVFSNARANTLDLGNGIITFFGTGGLLDAGTLTTIVPGTSTIRCTDSSATSRYITLISPAAVNNIEVTAGTGTFALNVVSCNNLIWTGFAGSWIDGVGDTIITGNLTFATGMTVAASADVIQMAGTSGTKDITASGLTIDRPITFAGVGSTWRLIGNYTGGSTRAFTVTSGTFNANGNDLTIGGFSSSGSGVRAVNMGTGTWTLTNSGTVWNTGVLTNMTLTPGTSLLRINNATATAKTLDMSNATINSILFTGAGTGALIINGDPTFSGDFTVDTQPKTVTFEQGGTFTVLGDVFIRGSAGNLITLQSSTATNFNFSKSSGVVISGFLNIIDSNATGGATWYAGTTSTDGGGGNTGWIFATAEISVTEPLRYSIKTTPAAIPETLAYRVKIALSQTETLAYRIVTKGSQTEPLAYRIVTKIAQTKSLAYAITSSVTEVLLTKALAYAIKATPIALTEPLVYKVKVALPITKSNKYTIRYTPISTQKILNPFFSNYVGNNFTNWTEGVSGTSTITVDTSEFVEGTASARLTVDGLNSNVFLQQPAVFSVTGGMKCDFAMRIKSSVAGKIQYIIADASIGTINYLQADGTWSTSINRFEVDTTTDWQVFTHNFVAYTNQTTMLVPEIKRSGNSTQAGKSFWIDKVELFETVPSLREPLQYTVRTFSLVSEQLRYAVRSFGVNTRSIQYSVKVPVPATKTLAYKIAIKVAVQKALAYRLVSDSLKTEGLQYALVSKLQQTKGLSYSIKKPVTLQKGLGYVIDVSPPVPQTVSKALQYRVKTLGVAVKGLTYAIQGFPYHKQNTPYAKSAAPYDSMITPYRKIAR